MKRIDPPDIDPRDTAAVARQTTALAEKLAGWSPGDKADAGTALIGAFATMAQQVITRLNQMPNRHFLAYLRMLGLQPNPPRAAEVPLSFTASAGTQGVRVPAGTQVRGQHPDGTSVTFRTNDVLELLPAGKQVLWRAITYQPSTCQRPDSDGIDRVSVDTAMATGKAPGDYGLFTADDAVEHAVYLAADDVLGVAATVRASITFSSSDDSLAWQSLQQSGDVVWEYFSSDSGGWESLAIDPDAIPADGNDFQFEFDPPADMAACALSVAADTTSARWIRVRLVALPSDATIPAWCGVTLSATGPVNVPAAPQQILFNGVPLDTGKEYYPLGRQPVFNDCCTLVLGALPSASDATLTVHVNVSAANADPNTGDDPALAWEIGSGDTWDAATADTWNAASPDFDPDAAGNDSVHVLKASGTVDIPLSAAASGVNQPALRIRLASGSYGTGITASTDPSNGTSVTGVTDDGCRPPILTGITVSARYTPSATPVCVSDNGEGRRVEDFARPVTPFVFRDEEHPAFYLAFGESLGEAPVSMYLEVSPLSGATRADMKAASAASNGNGSDGLPVVQWDYSAADASGNTVWNRLQVDDGTHDFSQSGFLRFIVPADHARSAQFGPVPLYWLRARLSSGGYAVPPRAGRVLLNSVAASNARTIRDEVLGSSLQTPGEAFVLAHTPVLDGPELMVREPEEPPGNEAARLRAQFGSRAIVPASARPGADSASEAGDAAGLGAVWVRWQQVGSFAASRPQDSHYTLDHDTGTVTFGDGRNGRVPPAGKNNVVMACYRSGGGAVGNLPAGAINQLVTAVAHVAAVDNAIASAGGADGEDSSAVMDWGPRMLRHRGRAVARQDYEDLVRQAFPQIAKVSAITPSFDPTNVESVQGAGHVLVVVVPDNDSACPAPTLGLLQQIHRFLRARMPPAVPLGLSGPDWLVVDVEVHVATKRMDRAGGLGDEVARALRHFLNPLSGGFDHSGWALGQMVHDSDLMRYLLALPGVDGISDLTVTRTPVAGGSGMAETTADQTLTAVLVCSGSHTVTVIPPGSA